MSLTRLPGFTLDTSSNVTFANANVTGNLTSGNANLGNLVTANFFSGNGSLLTGITITGAYSNTNTAAYLVANPPTGTYSNTNTAAYLPTYTGNVSANYFIGNGSLLTNITGANVSGQVSNALISSTVYTNAQPNITSVGTLTGLTVTGNSTINNVSLTGNIIPNVTNTYALGNATHYFKDAFIGPGSLYVNGKKVLEEVSGTINFTTDINQNLKITTSGSGDILFDPTGTGVISIKGPLQIEAGINITSSDGNAIHLANPLSVDSITTHLANTDLALSANGTGTIRLNDDVTVSGNLTVSGTTTYINTETVQLYDNIIDLNSNFTTGSPTENAGVRVLRGDDAAVLVRWNETTDKWQYTTDGSVYVDIVGTTSLGVTNLGNSATANYFTGNGSLLTSITGSNVSGNVTSAVQSHYSNIANSVAGANVSGQVTYAGTANSVAGSNVSGAVSSATTAGTVTTAAQPNITSVGTLTTLTSGTHTISANANITMSGSLSQVSGANLVSANYGAFGGQILGQTFNFVARSTDNVIGPFAVQATATNNYSGVSFFDSSNALAGSVGYANPSTTYYPGQMYMWGSNGIAFSGNGYSAAGGTKNMYINSSGIVTIPTGVSATNTTTGAFVVTGGVGISGNLYAGNLSGTNITGTLTTGAQPNITSVGTLTSLAVTGNISAGNVKTDNLLYANGVAYSLGSGATVAGSNTQIQFNDSGSFGGDANLTFNKTTATLTANYVTGTLTTVAQPNITSVGTLSSLTVGNATANTVFGNGTITATGNIAFTGANVSLGSVSNIKIPGGAANYYLKTDGAGNVSWATLSGAVGGGGVTLTSATSPPGSGNLLGDQWYNTSSDVLYEYINDGTAAYWVDVSSPTTTTTVPTTLNLANISIAGGSNGQALVSNGAGGLSFATLTSNIYNGNSNVTVVANSNVTFNISGTANVLTVTSTGANLISTGTANLGNLATANYVTGTLTTAAQPNITSVGTLANLTVSGNITTNGILTMPAVPAFLAGINSSTDATVTVGTAIQANIAQYNIGNYYNTSTYRFTAPVAGLYNFTVGIYFTNSGSSTQVMQVGLRKNGSYVNGGSDTYGCITMQPNNFTGGVNQSVIIAQFLLAANDYIDVAPRTNSLRHYQGHYWFQGYLIG